MEVKGSVNPVGTAIVHDGINALVEKMKSVWTDIKSSASWWQIWKKIDVVPLTNFLIICLDDLIAYTDNVVDTSGADKKATVLKAMGDIYDFTVAEALPVLFKPFNSQIKNYVINVLVSAAIDWMVSKYRNGAWRQDIPEVVATKWSQN